MQDDNLRRLEEFWEKMHDDESRKWEDLMATKPMVQYVERDDTLKLSQSLVDHLQHSLRTELNKIRSNIDMQEVDLQSQINMLKKENFDADQERIKTIIELQEVNKALDNQKHFDDARSKYVY